MHDNGGRNVFQAAKWKRENTDPAMEDNFRCKEQVLWNIVIQPENQKKERRQSGQKNDPIGSMNK